MECRNSVLTALWLLSSSTLLFAQAPTRTEPATIPPLPATVAPLPCTTPVIPDIPKPAQSGALGGSGLPQPTPTIDIPPPAPGAAGQPSASRIFEIIWNNGVFIKSTDGQFSAHVGGTIHYDGAWYSGGQGVQFLPGGVGRFSDGANARRMRLYMEGTLYKDFDYKFELEFMNGFSSAGLNAAASRATVSNSPGPTDAWVQIKNVPFLGNIRIGSQKEWFGLERLENYRTLLYMERSYLFDFALQTPFNNGFSPGVSTFRTWFDDRIFTAAGVYKNESDLLGFGVNDGNYAFTTRAAGLPIWMPEQKTYWHVGGAYSHRDPVDGQVQVNIRNSVRNAPNPLLNLIGNTGTINATSQDLFNLETAFAYGPLTLSGEYTANLINGASVGGGPSLGTLMYEGFYLQGMFFWTGEHREWDPKLGIFKRVVPKRNLSFSDGGWGAVETGVRYTYLNLDDKGVTGGRLNNLTLGTTWYWNPNARMQFNYDYVYRDGGTNPDVRGAIHSLGMRLALDF